MFGDEMDLDLDLDFFSLFTATGNVAGDNGAWAPSNGNLGDVG